jgi:hypothetical protein
MDHSFQRQSTDRYAILFYPRQFIGTLLDHPCYSYPYYMQNEIELHLQFLQGHDQLKQGSAFGRSSEVSAFQGLIVRV